MNRFLKDFVRCLWMIAVAMVFSAIVFAQDEQLGSTVTYPLSASYCGQTGGEYTPASAPLLNCFGLSFQGGSTWIYTSVSYSNALQSYQAYGYGHFYGATDLSYPSGGSPEYTVTSSSMSVDPNTIRTPHQGFPSPIPACDNDCTTFTANIIGMTPDDFQPVSATLTATLLYYVSRGREYVMVLPSKPGDGTGLMVRY